MRFGPLADKPPLRGYVPLSTLKPGIQNNQIIQLRPYGKLHIQTKAVGFGVFVEVCPPNLGHVTTAGGTQSWWRKSRNSRKPTCLPSESMLHSADQGVSN